MSTKNASSNPSPGSSRLLRLGWVLFLVLLLGLPPLGARAAVDLISFEAFPEGDAIYVTWETASEIDMAGFFVQRAAQIDGTYVRISNVIPAEGGMMGQAYEVVDDDVAPGDTFYYRLEALEVTGFTEYFGPVSATLPLPPTATPTPTPSPTLTPPFSNPGGSSPLPTATSEPPTATSPPPTATPTTTPRPTRTPRPATSTPTPQPPTATPAFTFRSPTPAATGSPSPTAVPPTTEGSTTTPSPTPTLTPLIVPTQRSSAMPPDQLELAEAGGDEPTASATEPAVKDADSSFPLWLMIPCLGLALAGFPLVAIFLRRRLGRLV